MSQGCKEEPLESTWMQAPLALNPGDGQEQVLEASPCCSQDVLEGLIWGTDRDAEMEEREMEAAFLFSCRKPLWCPGMSLTAQAKAGCGAGLSS